MTSLVLAFAIAVVYWFLLRRWFCRWGTRRSERARAMTGDAIVAQPTHSTTLAVSIAALPEDVWPWLVQMGKGRGGLYSYDWLDRLFGYLDGPSADLILPEFQHLAVGDEIPVGRGGGFPVTVVEPYRVLVLSGKTETFQWSWEFALYAIAGESSMRLVSRNRARVAPSFGSWCFMRLLEPAAFLMTRRMLLGLKDRGELLARARGRRADRAA